MLNVAFVYFILFYLLFFLITVYNSGDLTEELKHDIFQQISITRHRREAKQVNASASNALAIVQRQPSGRRLVEEWV